MSKPKTARRKRTLAMLSDATYRGCPLTKNSSPWCFRLCIPQEGKGQCERLAPHAMTSTIQEGIREFKRRKAAGEARPTA